MLDSKHELYISEIVDFAITLPLDNVNPPIHISK